MTIMTYNALWTEGIETSEASDDLVDDYAPSNQ